MDPVNCFVERALDAVTYLDYVAKCCQSCDREFADSLIGNDLASYRLQRRFGDLEPLFRPHGIDGADPATAARWVQVNVDRTIDGLEIDRDWRAWWNVRSPILDAIQWLRESAPYPIAPPDFGTALTLSPPAEPSTPASSTPSVHDIAGALTDKARDVLQAMLDGEAFDPSSRLTGAELRRRAKVSDKQLRVVMKSERQSKPIRVSSERNRRGGYWLTAHGKEVARCFLAE